MRKTPILIGALLLATVPMGLLAQAQSQETAESCRPAMGGLQVQVLDAFTAEPIANARVGLYGDHASLVMSTDADGVAYTRAPQGRYMVLASARGYHDARTDVFVAADEITRIRLGLEAARDGDARAQPIYGDSARPACPPPPPPCERYDANGQCCPRAYDNTAASCVPQGRIHLETATERDGVLVHVRWQAFERGQLFVRVERVERDEMAYCQALECQRPYYHADCYDESTGRMYQCPHQPHNTRIVHEFAIGEEGAATEGSLRLFWDGRVFGGERAPEGHYLVIAQY
ncbi:MAG TPA: carboxypeptidase-like regulatory domain-containing protein, partial [Candidatus Thermoplasmatota archaeon]|nr:carboxypeptidase-like regulatory domain-containing protein [Candidatus Thermoplasmatota archaeon]